jgi:hypothetical protein
VVLGDAADPVTRTGTEPAGSRDEPGPSYQPEPEHLDQQVGDYLSPELDVTYRIRSVNDYMRLEAPERLASALLPVEADVYRLGGVTFHFERNDAGEIQGLRLDADRVLDLRFERLAASSGRRVWG